MKLSTLMFGMVIGIFLLSVVNYLESRYRNKKLMDVTSTSEGADIVIDSSSQYHTFPFSTDTTILNEPAEGDMWGNQR